MEKPTLEPTLGRKAFNHQKNKIDAAQEQILKLQDHVDKIEKLNVDLLLKNEKLKRQLEKLKRQLRECEK